MSRPSHWILGFLAVLGGALWWTGALEAYLSARPAVGVRSSEAPRGPAVVRRDSVAPKPTNAEVSGRVVDRLGFPVRGATVRIAGETSEPVTTDARGRFQLVVSGAVHKRLRIETPGVHEAIEVPGSLDEVDVVLQDALPWDVRPATTAEQQPRGLLFGEGWIKDASGRHVEGVRVSVRETGATARTDGDGRYVVPLGEGATTLVAFDGVGGVCESTTLTPPRRQGKVLLPELQLALGPTLRGRLMSADGEPLVDAAVVVETGGVRRTVRTEQGGLFAVAGLVAGEAELIVLPHRGHLGTHIPLMIERDASLPDIVLHRPRQEPLRLQVVDPAGAPKALFHVVAEQLDGLCRAYGQADAQGSVVLAGLGDGDIRFEVRAPSLQLVAVQGFDADRRRLVVAP